MREVALEEDALCGEAKRKHEPARHKADRPAACGSAQPHRTRKGNRKQRAVKFDEIARNPQCLVGERMDRQRMRRMWVAVLMRELRQPVEIDERMKQRVGS